MTSGLDAGRLLDLQWQWMNGEMERTKQPTLALLARIFEGSGIDWALIDGLALQIHRSDPRTTLDIDIAITDRNALPATALETAGFTRTGRFEHSENWVSGDGVPVQLTDDPALGEMIVRAESVDAGGMKLRVLTRTDLLREKIRASRDSARRPSKRLQDLADATALLEDDPTLGEKLTPIEKEIVEKAGP